MFRSSRELILYIFRSFSLLIFIYYPFKFHIFRRFSISIINIYKTALILNRILRLTRIYITYYFFPKVLTSSEAISLKYKNGVATLKIGELYPEDEGVYVCTASNSLGSTETSCKLTVKCKRHYYLFVIFF